MAERAEPPALAEENRDEQAEGEDGQEDPQPAMDMFRRMTAALEQMGTAAAPHRREFKAPKFDGTGDVEFFIDNFLEVAEESDWEQGGALLHLRQCLKGDAKECGKAFTLNGVMTNLRARFGVTPKEARAQLAALKRSTKTSLQEHATEVERLVKVAYAELTPAQRTEMAIETFSNTLSHPYLQRHLLAVPARTLDEAVRAGKEYLNIKLPSSGNVRQVDEEPTSEVQAVSSPRSECWDTLTKTVMRLAEQVQKLASWQATQSAGTPHQSQPAPSIENRVSPPVCWGCHQPGHTRRRCPSNPWPKVEKAAQVPGNDQGPQQ